MRIYLYPFILLLMNSVNGASCPEPISAKVKKELHQHQRICDDLIEHGQMPVEFFTDRKVASYGVNGIPVKASSKSHIIEPKLIEDYFLMRSYHKRAEVKQAWDNRSPGMAGSKEVVTDSWKTLCREAYRLGFKTYLKRNGYQLK